MPAPSRKQEVAEQIMRQQTEKEMQECKFRPTLESKQPKKTSAKVQGLDRYFELKDLHRRQQQNKLAREKEVFGLASKV